MCWCVKVFGLKLQEQFYSSGKFSPELKIPKKKQPAWWLEIGICLGCLSFLPSGPKNNEQDLLGANIEARKFAQNWWEGFFLHSRTGVRENTPANQFNAVFFRLMLAPNIFLAIIFWAWGKNHEHPKIKRRKIKFIWNIGKKNHKKFSGKNLKIPWKNLLPPFPLQKKTPKNSDQLQIHQKKFQNIYLLGSKFQNYIFAGLFLKPVWRLLGVGAFLLLFLLAHFLLAARHLQHNSC